MKLNIMLSFPSLNLKLIIWIAQAFLILSLSVHTNQAGLIKKRDLAEVESTTITPRLSQNDPDLREREVAPTILTAVKEESDIVSTKLKLQPVNTITNLTPGTSKELSYNEISLNEAKKQLQPELANTNYKQNSSSTNETNLKLEESALKENSQNSNQSPSSTIDIEDKTKTEGVKQNSNTEITSNIVTQEKKQTNLETSPQKLDDKLEDFKPLTTTNQFISNAIKEEQLQKTTEQENEVKVETSKLTNRFKQLEVEHNENSLKSHKEKPRPPSQILPELKTEDVEEVTFSTTTANDIHSENTRIQHTGLDNHHDEHLEDQLMRQTTESKQVVVTETTTEQKDNQNLVEVLKTIGTNKETINTNSPLKEKEEETPQTKSLESVAKDSNIELSLAAESTTITPQNIPDAFSFGPVYKPEEETNTLETTSKSAPSSSHEEEKNVQKTFNSGPVYKPQEETTIKTLETSSKSATGPVYKPEEETIIKTVETTSKSATGPVYKPEEETIIKSLETTSKPILTSSHEEQSNSIQDGLDREELLKPTKLENLPQTTTDSIEIKETTLGANNEEESTLLDGNKMEHARSMFTGSEYELKEKLEDQGNLKESTTLPSRTDNEIYTTSKPVILSIKETSNINLEESAKETTKEFTADTVKDFVTEKKPKFINDNSANAQQLNLPNNADVWSLAAMKSLPKANVTIDTAQKHNISKEINEENLQNQTFSVSSNSEKNLLDWSQIMKDKELATTARNQNQQQKEEEEEENSGNQLTNEDEKLNSTPAEELEKEKLVEVKDISTTTTVLPEQTLTQPSIESREDMPKIKPLIEQQDFSSTTITPNYSILSNTVNDNNSNNTGEDKNITPALNKYNGTLTSLTAETQNTTTTTNNNNPFETNLNEINLTSNQNQQHNIHEDDELNTMSTTTTTAMTVTGNQHVDVNSVVTERAIETTKATAGVVDMNTLEQNSIELTTLSSLETGKQNASQLNVDIQPKNNVISAELEKTGREAVVDNKFENIELDNKVTTTSEIPVTTYRPTNLAITSTSLPPPSFKQEVDQNGNEIQTKLTENNNNSEQKQSITEGSSSNSSTATETHLSELELETTTLETIRITSKNPENTHSTTTTTLENTTSSSKDEIINEQIQKLEVTTTQATPKNKEDNEAEDEITTIGSPVIETKFEKEKQEIETTTEFAKVTAKTPVVIETQGIKQSESSTKKSELEEDKIETTQTNQITDNAEEQTQKPVDNHDKEANNELATTMATYPINTTTIKTEEDETLIKLLDDTTTTSQPLSTITTETPTITTLPTTTTTTTTTTTPSPITTKIEEIYKVIHTTTTEAIQTTTAATTSQFITETTEDESYPSPTASDMLPITTPSIKMIETADIGKSLPTLTSIMGGNSGNMYPKNSEASGETDVNVIIAITVSVIGVVALILLVGFLYLMRQRQKQTSYPQRCRPVSLDEYTIDNVSVGGSMRKTSALRSSKRTYGNLAFDDASLRHNAIGVHELSKFVQEKLRIFEEFRDVPQVTARLDEVPQGCEEKNRYANVLPLPETRVILQRLHDDDNTEYINANYVTGPKDTPNYYIACQAPLDTTVEDFWRMIWEQQSRVIIQATDLIENGVEKCAEYLPPSVTLDNHSAFGDFQITLQNREVKDKYAISTILLKHVAENSTRELTHYWYKWPEVGVPAEEAPIIAMLLEARSSLISYAIELANEDKEKSSLATLKAAEEGTASANGTTASPSKDSNGDTGEINGNISMVPLKKTARNQGPLTIHCSPGTGRTGTIIACDIAIRSLETPKRIVDVPHIVYYVRRGRASAVLTKEQYEFIYKVANMYAAKISNPTNYN